MAHTLSFTHREFVAYTRHMGVGDCEINSCNEDPTMKFETDLDGDYTQEAEHL